MDKSQDILVELGGQLQVWKTKKLEQLSTRELKEQVDDALKAKCLYARSFNFARAEFEDSLAKDDFVTEAEAKKAEHYHVHQELGKLLDAAGARAKFSMLKAQVGIFSRRVNLSTERNQDKLEQMQTTLEEITATVADLNMPSLQFLLEGVSDLVIEQVDKGYSQANKAKRVAPASIPIDGTPKLVPPRAREPLPTPVFQGDINLWKEH